MTDPTTTPPIDWTPEPKITVAAVAGAITILIVFIVQSIFPDFSIPPEVASAFTAIIAVAAGYWKKP